MSYLAISIGGEQIDAPSSIPTGGIDVLGSIFKNGISIMLILAVVLSLIFIILSGLQWIRSEGDKAKIQAARARLTWAVGGLIVAFLAFFVVNIVGFLFGVNLLGFG